MDGRFGIHCQLVDEVVVWLLCTIGGDYGHFSIVEDGVTLCHPKNRRAIVDGREFVFTSAYLGCIGCRVEFAGVGPDDDREGAVFFGVVSFGEGGVAGEVYAVGSFIGYFFPGCAFECGIGVDKGSDWLVGSSSAEGLYIEVGDVCM